MGAGLRRASCCPTATPADADAGLRGDADPEIRAHVRDALRRAGRPRSPSCRGADAATSGSSSRTGCCSTSSRRSTWRRSRAERVGRELVEAVRAEAAVLDALARVLDRRRWAVLRGRGRSCSRPVRSAAGRRPARHRRRLRRPAVRGGRARATTIERSHRALGRAGRDRARAARRRGRHAAGAAQDRARCAPAIARPRRRRRGRYARAAAAPLVSQRRPLDLPARDLLHGPTRTRRAGRDRGAARAASRA